MTIENLRTKLADLEAKREALIKKKKPIEAAITRCYNQINKLAEEISVEELKTQSGDLSYLLNPKTFDTKKVYKARQAWAKKRGVSFSGSYQLTNQPACSIGFKRNQDTSQVLETILLMVPHYIPIEGVVIFQIMEHSLSENGIYSLWVSPDTKRAQVVKTTYGSDRTLFTGSLSDALAEIAENCYYD